MGNDFPHETKEDFMKIKTKLTTAIMSLVFVLGLLAVGVYALDKAEVMLGGNLTFTADGVYAEVTGSVEGAVTNPTYEDLLFSANNTPDQSSWQNKELAFDANGTDIVITINIHNLATDRPLYAKISDTAEEVENVVKSVKKDGADVLDESFEVTAGQIAVITITFDLQNDNLSLDANSLYGYKIELNKDDLVKTDTYYANYGLKFEAETSLQEDAKNLGLASASVNTTEIKANDGMPRVKVISSIDMFSLLPSNLEIPAYVYITNEDGTTTKSKVTQIGTAAFCDINTNEAATNIQTIKLPSTIESVGIMAFVQSPIVTIDLPQNLKEIGMGAFMLSSLTEISISDSITSIGNHAFYGCSGLTSITVKAMTPPTFGTSAFYDVPSTCPIYVPSESVDAYKAASGWSDRAEYIQAITA